MSNRDFKIEGMDCAEEIAVLKQEVGPVVGGQDKLSRVSCATRFHSRQTSVCPMRCIRPKRCSIRLGFHGRS